MTETPSAIVLIGTDGPSTNAIYHALQQEFADVLLVIEKPQSRIQLLRRRRQRLGLWTVIGQLLFLLMAVPLLERIGRPRISEIIARAGLDLTPIPNARNILSVNSPEAQALLREIDPTVVVISGTRIISQQTIECVPAQFINMHAGITPSFRGVHGGYWALSEGRPDLVGTTVHLVDRGIDTGLVLGQRTFTVDDRRDSFATYPFLHLAAGLPCLLEAVDAARQGSPPAMNSISDLPSRLWSHPTLWGYIANRIRAGVK